MQAYMKPMYVACNTLNMTPGGDIVFSNVKPLTNQRVKEPHYSFSLYLKTSFGGRKIKKKELIIYFHI